jgi:YHS domain-containing protein
MVKDLVCNMDVDEKTAKYKTIYQGKYYYFCAPGCKKAFETNPQKYLSGSSVPSGHSCNCGGHC